VLDGTNCCGKGLYTGSVFVFFPRLFTNVHYQIPPDAMEYRYLWLEGFAIALYACALGIMRKRTVLGRRPYIACIHTLLASPIS